MIEQIVASWRSSNYDFRNTANPNDPLSHLFDEWVEYYKLKRAIATAIRPASILEIGVRYGYSAMAFLDGSPGSRYVGIDLASETFGGSRGALDWAMQAMRDQPASFILADTQKMDRLPGGTYDLIHVDGQQDGDGTFHDLTLALAQARYILVDGYFWSQDNLQAATSFLEKFRDVIEYAVLVPGYAGELLIKVNAASELQNGRDSVSGDIRDLYDSRYYLRDCGGYDIYKQNRGKRLDDSRLRTVSAIAEIARPSRVLDVGCGRGELVYHFAAQGMHTVGVDYSPTAIELAERCFEDEPDLRARVQLICGDACSTPLDGPFDAVTASDVIEHLASDELERLYSRVAGLLAPSGVFVVHTFPNLWFYQYEYRRRRRLARQLGLYLPPEPRTRYELMMHINEQSPRRMLRQLRSHFRYVLLWFGAPENAAGNLGTAPRKDFVRSAPSLFAVASHNPIRLEAIQSVLRMPELPALARDALRLQCSVHQVDMPVCGEFFLPVELENRSDRWLTSWPPFPVHFSYHWTNGFGAAPIFDGARSPLVPALAPGACRRYSVRISAPGTAGTWILRLTLVQEAIRWFDRAPTSLMKDVVVRVSD